MWEGFLCRAALQTSPISTSDVHAAPRRTLMHENQGRGFQLSAFYFRVSLHAASAQRRMKIGVRRFSVLWFCGSLFTLG